MMRLNTSHVIMLSILQHLYKLSKKRSKWFAENQKKDNNDICHSMMSSGVPRKTQVGNTLVKNSDCEKLLRVKIDHKLTFYHHITDLSKKANGKMRAMTITLHMGLKEMNY